MEECGSVLRVLVQRPSAAWTRVFGKVSNRKTRLVLKLRKFKMYDTGEKLNGNYLIPLKLFLVECYS